MKLLVEMNTKRLVILRFELPEVAVICVSSIYCAQRLLPEIFTITLCHCYFVVTRNPYMASNNKILLSLYGKYLAMDLDCDGTWEAV